MEWAPESPQKLASMDLVYPASFPFDVYRAETPYADRPTPTQAAVNFKSLLPPVECAAGTTARRFAIPFFPCDGTPVERFLIGDLIAAGRSTRVFMASERQPPVSDATIELGHEIVRQLELGLRSYVEDRLFPIGDLDSDEHLTIVICELADRPTDSSSEEPIHGCVRQKDFQRSEWQFGGDIIYLDRRIPRGKQLSAVLAHELAHASVFSERRRLIQEDRNPGQLPFWMNEGIAHLIEHAVCPESENLARRISAYRDRPNSFPLVIPDSFRGRRLRRGPSRAAALSFFQFATECDRDFLADAISGCYSPENGMSEDWERRFLLLFRRWMARSTGDNNEVVLKKSRFCRMTLAGTAFATFAPTESSGFVSIRASEEAKIQVVIVPPPASPDRVTLEPKPERQRL